MPHGIPEERHGLVKMELRIDPNYGGRFGTVHAMSFFSPYLGTLWWCDTLTHEVICPLCMQTDPRTDGMEVMRKGARRLRDLLDAFLAGEGEYDHQLRCFVVKERGPEPRMGFEIPGWDRQTRVCDCGETRDQCEAITHSIFTKGMMVRCVLRKGHDGPHFNEGDGHGRRSEEWNK